MHACMHTHMHACTHAHACLCTHMHAHTHNTHMHNTTHTFATQHTHTHHNTTQHNTTQHNTHTHTHTHTHSVCLAVSHTHPNTHSRHTTSLSEPLSCTPCGYTIAALYVQYSVLPTSLAKFSPEEPDIVVYTGYGMNRCLQFYSLSQRKVNATAPSWHSPFPVLVPPNPPPPTPSTPTSCLLAAGTLYTCPGPVYMHLNICRKKITPDLTSLRVGLPCFNRGLLLLNERAGLSTSRTGPRWSSQTSCWWLPTEQLGGGRLLLLPSGPPRQLRKSRDWVRVRAFPSGTLWQSPGICSCTLAKAFHRVWPFFSRCFVCLFVFNYPATHCFRRMCLYFWKVDAVTQGA